MRRFRLKGKVANPRFATKSIQIACKGYKGWTKQEDLELKAITGDLTDRQLGNLVVKLGRPPGAILQRRKLLQSWAHKAQALAQMHNQKLAERATTQQPPY
jgi:hypothetical protein